MVLLDKTIEVACAPARAFAVLAEPASAPAWQPWTPGATPLDAERFRMEHDLLGLRLAWTGVAEADPVRRIAFRQDEGDFEAMEGTWDVQPLAGQRSRIRLRMRVALPFVLPLLVTNAEVDRALSTSLDEAMFNLKSLLEGPAPRERAGSGLARGLSETGADRLGRGFRAAWPARVGHV